MIEAGAPNVGTFEHGFTKDVAALAAFMLPVLQALVAAAALSVPAVLEGGFWRVGPASGLVIAAAWFIVGRRQLVRNLPVKADANISGSASRLVDLTLPPTPRRRFTIAVAAVLVCFLATPVWLACVAWATLAVVHYFYWNHTHRAVLLGGITALVACVVIVLLGAVSANPSVSASASASFLLIISASLSIRMFVRARRVAFKALIAVIVVQAALVLLPLLADQSVVPLTLTIVALVLSPAVCFVLVLSYQRNAREGLVELLGRLGPRAAFGIEPEGLRAEDTIREGDGYYQVVYPQFRTTSAAVNSEAGYLTWLGDRAGVQLTGDAVVLRDSSLVQDQTRFLSNWDRQGRGIAAALRGLVVSLDYEAMKPVQDALLDSWSVRRARSPQQALVKMPWDHPLTLVVPTMWSRTWIYPPGAGVHDRNGYPCVVRKVEVEIALRPEVLAAVDGVATGNGSSADIAVVRSLAANATRLLPGVFETLLMALVSHLRRYHSDIFFVEGETSDVDLTDTTLGRKRRLLAEANEDLARMLPTELQQLIAPRLLDLRVEALYAEDVHDAVERYRQASVAQLQTKWRDARQLRDEIRDRVLGSRLGEGVGTREQVVELRDALSSAVHAARGNIDASGRLAVNKLGQLTHADRHANAFPQVQRALVEEHERFSQLVEESFDRFDHALAGLATAAKDNEDG